MEFFRRIKEWRSRHFVVVIACIFLLKLGLLFWSAHPFDFAAFVSTMERHSITNWNIFEYWNKGNFLIIMWYPFYAFYLLILQFFHLPADQLLLLHFFFKYPFWVMDMLCMVLVMALGIFFTRSEAKAKWAGLLWALNPLVFAIYGIHGHYELLVGFSLLLLFAALAWELPVLFGFAFALAFSTKYFIVIITPLFFFYLLSKKNYTFMWRASISAVFFTILSYIQFFSHPELIQQTIGSIKTLSQAYVSTQDPTVTIGVLNIFSMTRFFLGQDSITNLANPAWYTVAQYSFWYIGIFSIFMYARQCYYLFIKKIKYSVLELFKDSLLVLLGFMILLTNFQWHYMIWLMPFFVLLAVIEEFYAVALGGVTLIGFLLFFRNEYGPRTFFLDLFDSVKLFTTSSMSTRDQTILSFALVFVFVSIIAYAYSRVARPKKTQSGTMLVIVCASISVWFLVIGTFSQVIVQYAQQKDHNTVLAYRRPSTPRGLVYGQYDSSVISSTGEITFKTKTQSNALTLEGLPAYIEKGKSDTFAAYIVFNSHQLFPNGAGFVFNGSCRGYYDSGIPLVSRADSESYIAVPVPVSCIKGENEIVLDEVMRLPGNLIQSPKLYIQSVASKYLYNPEHVLFVTVIGIIGIAGFLAGFGILAWLLNLLKASHRYDEKTD